MILLSLFLSFFYIVQFCVDFWDDIGLEDPVLGATVMAQIERCDGAGPVVSHSFIIDPSASHVEGTRDENIPTSAPVYVSEPQPYELVIAPETHVAAQPAETSSSTEAFIKNIEELFCDLESQPPGILGWCIFC